MAIRIVKRAKPYQVYWNNPYTGKRESATFTTQKEAEKHDALIAYRLKFEKESFLAEARGEVVQPTPKQAKTLEEVCDAYLEASGAYKKEKALRWRMDGLKLPLELYGSTPIEEITSENLEKILLLQLNKRASTAGGLVLTDHNVKPVTAKNRMKTLITVLNWAQKKGIIQSVPALPELPMEHYEHIVPPSESELQKLLDVAPPHLQRVIIIGARCGVRVGKSEMFRLQWHHVDFERGVLRVQAAEKNRNEPWREVPIQREILELFASWYKADLSNDTGYIIHFGDFNSVNSIRSSWATAKKNAGITRKLTPYSLRHKFATDLLATGTDPGTVAKLMGHTSTTMIFKHYQHVLTKQKVQAIESLPKLATSAICAQVNGASPMCTSHVHKPCTHKKRVIKTKITR